ncbi:MAG: hypothetical protein ACTHJ2_00505 [Candidatus Nitrosocosmicus sp.]
MNNDADNSNFDKSKDGDKLDTPLEEKWVVSFIRQEDLKRIYYRQFYAAGFYEAYDSVMNFLEKTDYKLLWYKEKRKCGKYFMDKDIPFLESICTFCNKKFNNIEPIKCNFWSNSGCKSEFCSFNCKQEHFHYIHINRVNKS